MDAHRVYEDDHTVAFLDVNPRAPGHIMIVPKFHTPTLLELPGEEVSPFFAAVKNVLGAVQRALDPDGFTLGINHGSVSGQTVDHLHFHIIPRYDGDGGGSVHDVVNNPPKDSLENIAEKIRGSNK